MKKELLKEAITKIVVGIILIGLLLFIPAGTLSWLYGWIPMLIAGIVMYFKAPDLLESRLRAKETQSEQKQVIGFSGIMFLFVFILAGLNYRFKWIILPEIVVYIGIAIFLLSYALFGEVLRENRYLSRVIEVQKDQKVVDSGLYGIVRHPMYFATLFLFLSMPLVLNSLPSFIVMLSYIPIIVKRIRNEEEVLEKELSGYKEYKRKVRYRLIPFMY